MMMFKHLLRVLWITFLGLSMAACAGNLETQILEEAEQAAATEEGNGSDNDSGATESTNSQEDEPKITNYPQDDGVVLTLANATDYETWVYFDFETQSQVFPENPVDSAEWDLAFMRFRVKLNGGYHGTGQVIACLVEEATLDNVMEVPPDGWQSDGLDVEDDEDEFPEELLSGWYEYESEEHSLTPIEQVYVVRTVEASYIKLEFAGYYDQEGLSGNPSIRWIILPEPIDGIVEPELEEPGELPPENGEES